MAESYSCDGEWVYFSNTACQELQLAWARIAEAHEGDPAMNELARALGEACKLGDGVAAIGIDEEFLDEPFSHSRVKVAWLRVMERLMDDIRHNGPVARKMDVNWSGELIESWIERLAKMKDCLAKQVDT